MNKAFTTVLSTFTLTSLSATATAQPIDLDNAFMLGVQLGELPWGGSFKPGLCVGYYLNELVYVGAMYQIGDSIRRDASSFNVDNTGLDGLVSSSEEVAPRGFFGVRVRPHRYAPFASLGTVYNGADTETMIFDRRPRHIGGGTYDSAITLRQTRASALRPAFGLGYSYESDFGLQLSTAWSGWLFESPKAKVKLDSDTAISSSDQDALRAHVAEGFGLTITNKYHIFHVGAGYVFDN
jgi:hypothetical protein